MTLLCSWTKMQKKTSGRGDGGGKRIKEGSGSGTHNLFKAKITESSKTKLLIICTRLTTLFDHAALARSCRTSGSKPET
jgi:hypothetical protein